MAALLKFGSPCHKPATFICSRKLCAATKFGVGPLKSRFNCIACPGKPIIGEFNSFTSLKGVAHQGKIVKAYAFRSASGIDGDDGIGSVKQEAAANQLESMLNRLGVWITIALFSALILWRHDALSLWAATGSIANVVLSYSLKGILNHERPISNLRSDPGMPSSHSQFMFFIVVFVTLSIFEWLGVNKLSLALGVLLLTMGGYFSWLRVAHQLHTVSQVVVGAAVGSVFCLLWNWSWTAFASKAFSSLLWVRILVSLGALSYTGTITWNFIRAWYFQEEL